MCADQNKCLSLQACKMPTPLLFLKIVVNSKMIPKFEKSFPLVCSYSFDETNSLIWNTLKSDQYSKFYLNLVIRWIFLVFSQWFENELKKSFPLVCRAWQNEFTDMWHFEIWSIFKVLFEPCYSLIIFWFSAIIEKRIEKSFPIVCRAWQDEFTDMWHFEIWSIFEVLFKPCYS